jgi:general secretion pathway protein D
MQRRALGWKTIPILTCILAVWAAPFIGVIRQGDTSSVYAQETPLPKAPPKASPPKEKRITLDFNNVDLTVFIKFVSEITGKNFIIDERVRGKVTIFSPTKISVDKVYEVFLSVMDLKGFGVVESKEALQILPAAEVSPERSINIYYLENANAEEMAKLLAGLVTRPAAPGAPGRKLARTAGEFEGNIQITADKAINALIITATPMDYELLKEIIKKLDVKRRQVFVEAVIMEVGQDKLRELGTDLGAVAGYVSPNNDVSVIGGFNADPGALAGFADIPEVGISTVNVQAILKLLQSMSDVNILSTPQLLTTNNQKARISVAQNVPFVTGASQAVGGVVQKTINRQDVGIILEITPEIMEGEKVKLDIRQEVSSLTETAPEVLVELGPTTNKRETSTSVIVGDHQTVVIAGLMRDDVTKSVKKIPILGDIPLIGLLFKFQSNRVTKTNLLIFLTPHIVRDEEDLAQLRQKKTDEMRKAMAEQRTVNREIREEFLNAINPPVAPSPR